MGGRVAIAARFNDGQTICVDGWTNFVPRMIMNEKTLSGDDSVVREMLLEAAALEKYEGPISFRSKEYGMIAIDFTTREIHTKQNYTNFTRKSLGQMTDANACGYLDGDIRKEFVHVISDEAGSMIDAGRVTVVARNGVDLDTPILLDRETALAMLREEHRAYMSGGGLQHTELLVTTDPFSVHVYPDDGPLSPMKERLKTSGFPMTKAEGLNAMFGGMIKPKEIA